LAIQIAGHTAIWLLLSLLAVALGGPESPGDERVGELGVSHFGVLRRLTRRATREFLTSPCPEYSDFSEKVTGCNPIFKTNRQMVDWFELGRERRSPCEKSFSFSCTPVQYLGKPSLF
jgi:hypothetical protein